MLGFGFAFSLGFMAQYSLNPSKSLSVTKTGCALFSWGCSKCWKADCEYWLIIKWHKPNSWRNESDMLKNSHLWGEKYGLKQWVEKVMILKTKTSMQDFSRIQMNLLEDFENSANETQTSSQLFVVAFWITIRRVVAQRGKRAYGYMEGGGGGSCFQC